MPLFFSRSIVDYMTATAILTDAEESELACTREKVALKIALLKRGLDARSLAALCGVGAGYLKNEMAYGFPAQRARLLVEHALGERIWSSVAEFKRRKEAVQLFGEVPELMGKPALRAKAIAEGLPSPYSYNNKSDLIAALHSFLRSKSKPKSP
jgi:hypothetical protein